MSTESELSTEDLARSGDVRPDERRTDDVRREEAPAASEMPPDRPPADPDSASAAGGPRQGMPPGATPGYDEAAGARAGAAAAERSGGPGPVPDSLGGGAGDQGPMQPGDPAGAGSAAPPSEPGAATGGATSAATDAGDRPPTDGARGSEGALLGSADEERFRQRWGDAQARFVDDPREAVRSADGLVAELMQSLAQGFSEHKARLESEWQRGGDPDTEELRQALQRYRSFFDRLLST
jgi:hypothetical protein